MGSRPVSTGPERRRGRAGCRLSRRRRPFGERPCGAGRQGSRENATQAGDSGVGMGAPGEALHPTPRSRDTGTGVAFLRLARRAPQDVRRVALWSRPSRITRNATEASHSGVGMGAPGEALHPTPRSRDTGTGVAFLRPAEPGPLAERPAAPPCTAHEDVARVAGGRPRRVLQPPAWPASPPGAG
jgi:hypothetical protein